uniref:7TM_GPCR_Srx domain-containing protein n=1 Tax=Steinernema glaseri TaxID=37863 RepID=A0A1I8A8C0_9BILA
MIESSILVQLSQERVFQKKYGYCIGGCCFKDAQEIVFSFAFASTIWIARLYFKSIIQSQGLLAFNIDDINTIDYTTKSWIILSALYGFFTVDRILQFILELRRRYQTKPKARKPAIAVLSSPAGERRRSQIKHMLAHEQDEIKHQIQDAMINNALVRTVGGLP